MDHGILELEGTMESANQPITTEMSELSQLQLAMIGGGCAEVCPY